MSYEIGITDKIAVSGAPYAKSTAEIHPKIIEIVRHMARVAAEEDYKIFLSTSKISYSTPSAREDGDD